jgi:hypothetical protein
VISDIISVVGRAYIFTSAAADRVNGREPHRKALRLKSPNGLFQ